ncbi:PIN domain-containing protein [Ferrovum sp.]|uniref:PIN domain-containing protein n=1 Tax=Ferrovum sp. TaxID=2609467 RepID=UPI002617DD7D|nr:PIN domain-containing protein [Ferrovum sp.]
MTTGTLPIQVRIRSEMLGVLRNIDGVKQWLGPLAKFVIVVDANIILGDLIWLVSKRKKPVAVTELMECIQAGTIVVYITRSVLTEVNKHISTIAADKNLSEAALRQEWKTYRKFVKVRTPHKVLVDRYKNGRDPDDAPTIALEKMVRAVGILSKDADIPEMGGLVIEMEFTKRAREYSRKTAVAATIRLSGCTAIMVSWAVLEITLKSIQRAASWLKRLPAPVQLIIFVAVVAVVSNRHAQKRVTSLIAQISASVSDYWPDVLGLLASIGTTLAENTVPPPVPSFSTLKNRTTDLWGKA